ncbi:MAG: class I SAM-dependent methyltransferase [Pseudomonadota bacterium]
MGFSADWLALREPADRKARDQALALRACEAAGPNPVILDLGSGTGATWRALTPQLPEGTRWVFVDNDPALLADAANAAGATAEVIEADIGDLLALPLEHITLVTASALLDLVPHFWVEEVARTLRIPFYAALSYSGVMRWTPGDPHDETVTECFNRHQRGDKGLGPALGPEAGKRAASIFADAGFEVYHADSPWHLSPAMAELQRELTDGIADAAAAAGAAEASAWGDRRRGLAGRSHCEIGHTDILAIPGRSTHGDLGNVG